MTDLVERATQIAEGIESSLGTVLVAMAYEADGSGDVASLNLVSLVAMCELHERTVRRAIKLLTEAGYLALTKAGGGRGNKPTYRVALAGLDDAAIAAKARALALMQGGTHSARAAPSNDPGSRLPTDWALTDELRAYAASYGLDPDAVAEDFTGYWHTRAGWRAVHRNWGLVFQRWVRTEAAKHGLMRRETAASAAPAKGAPLLTLVAGTAVDDPYGAETWAARWPGATLEPFGSVMRPCVAGYDLAAVARQACKAAGFAPAWRGNLDSIAAWLADGVEATSIAAAIQRRPKPGIRSMAYWDGPVREQGAAAAATQRGAG